MEANCEQWIVDHMVKFAVDHPESGKDLLEVVNKGSTHDLSEVIERYFQDPPEIFMTYLKDVRSRLSKNIS